MTDTDTTHRPIYCAEAATEAGLISSPFDPDDIYEGLWAFQVDPADEGSVRLASIVGVSGSGEEIEIDLEWHDGSGGLTTGRPDKLRRPTDDDLLMVEDQYDANIRDAERSLELAQQVLADAQRAWNEWNTLAGLAGVAPTFPPSYA